MDVVRSWIDFFYKSINRCNMTKWTGSKFNYSYFIQSIIVLFFISILPINGLNPAATKAELESYINTYLAKNVLTFNQSCSYSIDQVRLRLLAQTVRYGNELKVVGASRAQLQESYGKFVQAFKEVASLPGQFCNTHKVLECSLVSSTCTCQAWTEWKHGGEHQLVFIPENGSCRIAPNSFCIATPSGGQLETSSASTTKATSENPPAHEFICHSSTSCVLKRNGRDCSLAALEKELETVEYRNGICICAPLVSKGLASNSTTTSLANNSNHYGIIIMIMASISLHLIKFNKLLE